MPSLFSGLNIALQSMLAHQQSVQVIEHNVANANTPGYRRQEVQLGPTPPYHPPGLYQAVQAGQIGTGVVAESIRRFNLDFFDGRYRDELAASQQWESFHGALQQVEATLAETSSDGILSHLDSFWAGWQALSNDPGNMTLRQDLHIRAQTLAEGLNRRATALTDFMQDQDALIIQDVDEINLIAEQIASLNAEISQVLSIDEQPNDLLDERDRLLDRLSELAGAASNLQENGEVLVSIRGHALVIGNDTFALNAAPDPGNNNLVSITWADGKSFDPGSGELAGLLAIRDTEVPNLMAALDDFASTLVTEVNAIHQNGYGINNASSLDFFSGSDALSIMVSSDVDDIRNIATAAAADSPGDGSFANQIASLQDALLMSSGTQTLNKSYTNLVATLGLDITDSASKMDNRQLVLGSLEAQRESVSGVSLDEEAANLIKSQRAYQASARLVTVIDEMLDRIINGMGVVGR